MYRPNDIGTENWVRCGFRDCYQCCLETEMLLSQNDLELIVSQGYNQDDFLLPIEETDGFFQLRNVDSPIGKKCFFLTDKGKCKLYGIKNDYRPTGCKLYPLIVNLDTGETMIDIDCREREWFKEQNYMKSQIISINSLVNTLLLESEDNKETAIKAKKKKKKKVGRPRKKKAAVTKPKKKVGRPRKKKAAETEPEKKKVGRPRKKKAAETESEKAESGEVKLEKEQTDKESNS